VLHPALRLEQQDYERAVERGKNLVLCGDNPYKAYSSTKSVAVRVTPGVMIREATCCWPGDEIAFAIAKQGEGSEAAIARAAQQARKRVGREIKFWVAVQLPKARDPRELTFLMRTNMGQSYPPIAVETPVYLRDIASALDPDLAASALYAFDLHFPIRGSPGYPAIGPEVTSLQLVVQDGDAEATVEFALPRRQYRY
jgi:hypothetical protein